MEKTHPIFASYVKPDLEPFKVLICVNNAPKTVLLANGVKMQPLAQSVKLASIYINFSVMLSAWIVILFIV